MKKIMTLIAFIAIAGGVSATKLVDFSAGVLPPVEGVFSSKTEHDSRENFDTTQPLFDGSPFFGGIYTASFLNADGSPSAKNDTVLLTRTPGTWPAYPFTGGYICNGGAGAHYNNVEMVYLWKKKDFAGNPATVSFDHSSRLSVSITDWWDFSSDWMPQALNAEIRHIVRQAGQAADTYWISQSFAKGACVFVLDDFNNSSVLWSEILLTSTDFGIGTKLEDAVWTAVDFTDVESVGWVGEGSKKHGGLYGFDAYFVDVSDPAEVNALPESD